MYVRFAAGRATFIWSLLLHLLSRSYEEYIAVFSGPNSTLEMYLCNGSLGNGTTLLVAAGEHVISKGPLCHVRAAVDVAILGEGRDRTVVRCSSDGGRGFLFSLASNLSIARLTFAYCGQLVIAAHPMLEEILSPVVLHFESSSSVFIWDVAVEYFRGFAVYATSMSGSFDLLNVRFLDCAAGDCRGALVHGDPGLHIILQAVNCLFSYASVNLYNGDDATAASLAAGLTLLNVTTAHVHGCHFANLSSPARSLVAVGTNATVVNTTFESQVGGAIASLDSYLLVSDSRFIKNHAHTGAGILAHYSTVRVVNSSFLHNVAATDGGAILARSNHYLYISGSQFGGNVAREWGGAVAVVSPVETATGASSLNVFKCSFIENVAQVGGALFVSRCLPFSWVTIDQTALQSNIASVGAAIYAGDFHTGEKTPSFSLALWDVLVQGNRCPDLDHVGAAVHSSKLNQLVIAGRGTAGSQLVGNFPKGAVQGLAGDLHLYGSVLFADNTAEGGGAINLLQGASLHFHQNCSVSFLNNTASRYGGAIYVQGDSNVPKFKLIQCAMNFNGQYENHTIVFRGNTAGVSGDLIYATPIYNCTLSLPAETNDSDLYLNRPFLYYDRIFDITESEYRARSRAAIVSFPLRVRLCGCLDGTKCIKFNDVYRIFTVPGKTIEFTATSFDSEYHVSPAIVYTDVPPNRNHIQIEPEQNIQWIGTTCNKMVYRIYGEENASISLRLTTNMGDATAVEVTIRPCGPGFQRANSTGLLYCNCSAFITSHGVNCNSQSGTFVRSGSTWLGTYNNGTEDLAAVAHSCPLDYCNSQTSNISLSTPEQLCDDGRQGLLCGHCPDNMSTVFGSTECMECSNLWLLTILLYALLGVILVAFIFVFNVTVSRGALYGTIFYANIVQFNAAIFFHHWKLKPLKIFISFINLDLGFPLCFYSNMDDIAKSGLQFVFPVYLLVLSASFVLLCKRFPTQSTRSHKLNWCLNKIGLCVGSRALSVISTLIYLTFCKILRTVIEILTYATVSLENGINITVWFYDGTVRYFNDKHLILSVISIFVSCLFLFPYALALTFIPIIDRFSDHHKLCRWIHRKTNKLKPLSDIYYAPFRGAWRSWLGVRLWLLFFLYIPTSVYNSECPSLVLFIHSIILAAFLFIQVHINPFEKVTFSLGGSKGAIRAEIVNWLDSFYILNYIILALTVSYLLSNGTNSDSISIATGSLVGFSEAMICFIILYRIVLSTKLMVQKVLGTKRRLHPLTLSSDLDGQNVTTLHTAHFTLQYSSLTGEEIRESLLEH